MIATDHFDLYGVSVSVRSDSAALRSAIVPLLEPFAADLGRAVPDLQCFLTSDETSFRSELAAPLDLQPRYAEAGSSYYISRDRSFLTAEGGACGTADPGRQRLTLYIPREYLEDHAWCTQHNLFRVLLLDLLRTRGIFPIHAAAVEMNGIGVLVTASSGGGKSTLSVALTRAGLRFLVDDVLLLHRQNSMVEALFLPDQVELHRRSLEFFPELATLLERPENARGKISFSVSDAYPGRTTDRCIPRMILFPTLTHQSTSRLRPLSPIEALCTLLPQSLWGADSEQGREHYGLLGQLVEQCTPYELAVGTDLEAAARLIIDALKKEEEERRWKAESLCLPSTQA